MNVAMVLNAGHGACKSHKRNLGRHPRRNDARPPAGFIQWLTIIMLVLGVAMRLIGQAPRSNQ